jgi:hypothetical protein
LASLSEPRVPRALHRLCGSQTHERLCIKTAGTLSYCCSPCPAVLVHPAVVPCALLLAWQAGGSSQELSVSQSHPPLDPPPRRPPPPPRPPSLAEPACAPRAAPSAASCSFSSPQAPPTRSSMLGQADLCKAAKALYPTRVTLLHPPSPPTLPCTQICCI